MVEVVYARGSSTARLNPAALAMWNAIIAAADRVGIAKLQFNAGQAVQGHVSHSHGTEIDFIGYNADGRVWNVRQRLGLAEAAASAGGNRFGFYTRPDRGVSILHAGIGYDGSPHNVAWGPNGRTGGVSVSDFYPEEQQFVASLRNGEIQTGYQPMAYAATSTQTQPDAFNHIFSTVPTLNAIIQRGGTLSTGDQGDGVRELQEFLNREGFHDANGQSLATDGKFGRRTREALMSYQRGHEIGVDGVVGPETFGTMFERITDAPAPPVVAQVQPPRVPVMTAPNGLLQPGDNGDRVRELQRFLNHMGITDSHGAPLEVDGDFGRRTREAVQSYQRANGLTPDGIVGPDTNGFIQNDWMQQVPAAPTPVIDTTGIVAGMSQVNVNDPNWGRAPVIDPATGAPVNWLPVPPAGPLPTTQQWSSNRGTGTIDPTGPNDPTPYDAPVVDGPSPQPAAQHPNTPPGLRPPDFATMSLNQLADWWQTRLSSWRPGQPTPVQPPEYQIAFEFRRQEAEAGLTAAQRDAQSYYRSTHGTNPRIAPPAPPVQRTIGEGEYLPQEQILLKQLNRNLVNAPRAVVKPQLPLQAPLRTVIPATSLTQPPKMLAPIVDLRRPR